MPPRRVEHAVYLCLALLGVLPTLLNPGHVVGDGVDAYGTHWFYWWIRRCVEHFGDPSHTNLFFFPFGKDIFAHTGNNFVDAVLAVPFAWVFGGTLYSPLWSMVILLGNVYTFRPLARYLLGDTYAAFAATLLWGINPYVHFELTAGRPTQAMLWFLPSVVYYFLRTSREPGWRNPLWFGLAVAVTGWTYWFAGFFVVLLLLPLAAWELLESRDRARMFARWALAVAVCAVIVLPGVYGMVTELDAGKVVGIDTTKGSIFEAPTPIGNNVSADLHGIWLMEMYGAPLFFQPAWGLPLLLAFFWRRVTLPGGRARWIVAFLFVLAFAGGTRFRFGDFTVLMPHYMVLYRHLPFFDRLWFPYRMASVLFIPAALFIGVLCAQIARPRAALAALVALGLAGQALVGTWPFNHHPAAAPDLVRSLREHGGAVIFLPMKMQHDGLMWQTEFELPTFGGMGESAPLFWPANFRKRLNNSLIKSLRGAAITPNQPRNTLPKDRAVLEKEGFRWVILRRTLLDSELQRQLDTTGERFDKTVRIQETIDAISGVVGAKPAGVGGDAVVWDLKNTLVVPAQWAATAENLAATGWEQPAQPVYEKMLELVGRTGGVREKTQPTRPK